MQPTWGSSLHQAGQVLIGILNPCFKTPSAQPKTAEGLPTSSRLALQVLNAVKLSKDLNWTMIACIAVIGAQVGYCIAMRYGCNPLIL